MAKKKLKEQKEMQTKVADHQVLFSAWISNLMEKDKQILTLSGLAIGLLVTFRSDVSKIDNVVFSIFWLVAGISFVISIVLVLLIFDTNSDYIKLLIRNEDKDNEDEDEDEIKFDKYLKWATRSAVGAFLLGVGLTYALAVYIVFCAS